MQQDIAIDAVGKAGWSAFRLAFHLASNAEALAKVGCDTTLLTNDGKTGLQIAQQEEHQAVVEMIHLRANHRKKEQRKRRKKKEAADGAAKAVTQHLRQSLRCTRAVPSCRTNSPTSAAQICSRVCLRVGSMIGRLLRLGRCVAKDGRSDFDGFVRKRAPFQGRHLDATRRAPPSRAPSRTRDRSGVRDRSLSIHFVKPIGLYVHILFCVVLCCVVATQHKTVGRFSQVQPSSCPLRGKWPTKPPVWCRESAPFSRDLELNVVPRAAPPCSRSSIV